MLVAEPARRPWLLQGTWTVVVLSEDGEEEVAEDKDVSIQAMVEAGDVMVTVPTYEPVQGEGSTEVRAGVVWGQLWTSRES